MAKPRLTLIEQERILEETTRLLKEPASWTTGQWKCDLYEVTKDGRPVYDGQGELKRACDANNRPLSQYCIEGGLNQATYNVLGEERAIKLGAFNPEYQEKDNYAFDSGGKDHDPAELLGINKLAMEIYEERILDRIVRTDGEEIAIKFDGSDAALILNDSFEFEDQLDGHKTIVGLVQTRLDQVRDELDAREEAHATKELVGQA